MAPAFCLDDPERVLNAQFTDIKVLDQELFLFWKDMLFATAFTSTGQIVIKKVRSVLNEADMLNVIKLENAIEAKDIYPVELYHTVEERFVCTCWSIEAEGDDRVIWHPVCRDDIKLLDGMDCQMLTEYPIELGETAVIGGETFVLNYAQGLEKYFVKAPKTVGNNMSKLRKRHTIERRLAQHAPMVSTSCENGEAGKNESAKIIEFKPRR